MLEAFEDWFLEWGLMILVSLFGVLFLGAIVWGALNAPPYEDPCIKAGGHWISKSTGGGIGFTTGGNMAFTPGGSVRFCISEDGRIIE